MSEERDQRIAELQEREQQLHELYMAAPCGHPAEKYYADELQALAQELEALYTERRAEWGREDARILRDIANGYSGSEL